MTLYEYQMRKVPESYHGMYLDGFTPEEILFAYRRSMMQSLAKEQSINYGCCFEECQFHLWKPPDSSVE